jgi:Mrp family chromosome partitioning ATPase
LLQNRKGNPASQAIAADCHVSIAAEIKRFVAGGTRQFLVTSAGPGEGKSSVLCEVGRALARQPELRIVLVDADQLRPAVHHLFGVDAAGGLGELIERTYAIDLRGEIPAEFGLGDWIELLQVQGRTGRLEIVEDGRKLLLTLLKGAIVSIQDGAAGAERRLGSLLTEAGHLTPDQRDQALKLAAESGEPLGEIALRMGFVGPEPLQAALRLQFGERLQHMLAMRQPRCRYIETTERELGVVSRDAAAAAGWAKQPGAMLMIRERLKQPYITRQLNAALKSTEATNLKLVTGGRTNSNLLEGTAPAALRCILDHLSAMFDVVLVDSPPVALGSPAEAISEMVGGTILVVQADRFESAVIRRAKDRLEKRGARILGVILNQVDLGQSDQSFHYYYLYYPTGSEGNGAPRRARSSQRRSPGAANIDLPPALRTRMEEKAEFESIGIRRTGSGRVLTLALLLIIVLGAFFAIRFWPWSEHRAIAGSARRLRPLRHWQRPHP